MNRYSVGLYLLSFAPTLIIPLALFSLDTVCLALSHGDFFHTLASFTLARILQKRIPPVVFLCFILLGIFSTITTGLFFMHLAFIGGLFLLAKALSSYSSHKLAIATITSTLLTLIPVIHSSNLPPFWLPYTILAITGNLITVYFSLKWSPAVKRSNRS